MTDQVLTPSSTSSAPSIPNITLTASDRCALKARAHFLVPAVMLGQQGLTENVIKAIDKFLLTNDLIKIRILGADHEARIELANQISQHAQAVIIQHIGRQLVLFRPLPKKKKTAVIDTTKAKSRTTHPTGFSHSTRPKPKATFTHKHRTSRFSER
ncbi:MAG: YhbY family RNA-binding protein [Pseudomonadota bacterium]